jgi:methionyl aminopeptidase
MKFCLSAGDEVSKTGVVNLFPSYVFSGPLRPFPQTPTRPVPKSIVRPDYADHAEGRSMSEEKMRGAFE